MTADALNILKEALNDTVGYGLNMSNYDHEDVHALNNAYVVLWLAVETAIKRLTDNEQNEAV